MGFDRRFVLVAGGSMLWALAVSAVFYRIAGAQGGRSRTAERPMVVAAQPLALGATLSRENVKLRHVPEGLFPAGAFSRVEDVLERPVISAIQADEPVVEARIAAHGSGVGLAPLIPAGMRAISVRVNDVVGVAGFILPGMRVDVLVTGKPPDRAETVTRTVLQNVTVLSAGQTLQTDGKNPAINTPVVTLLVTPDDAEALTLSNAEGHVQLVLRNTADQQVTGTRGRRLHELYGAATIPDPPAASCEKVSAAGCRSRTAIASGRECSGASGSLLRWIAEGSATGGNHHVRESEIRRRRAAATMIEAEVSLKPEYQELKFALHHKLLDRINLEALANIENDRVRGEVRQAVLGIVAEEPNLLTAAEKLQISDEVLHEVFGWDRSSPCCRIPGSRTFS